MPDSQMMMLRGYTVADWLRKGASKTPQKEAFIYNLKGNFTQRFTYLELNKKVNRVANALRNMGVKKGDRVAILSHNCPHFAFYIIAMTKIGAWITPLNFALREKEINYIVGHARPVVFVVEDELVSRVLKIRKELPSVKKYIVINIKKEKYLPEGWVDFDEMLSNKYSEEEPVAEINSGDVLNLMYTSGTEALPKAVMNTYGNWMATVLSGLDALHISKDTVILISVPLYHVAAMHLMFNVFLAGGTVVMHYEPEPNLILQLIDQEKINFIAYPPTVYVNLLKLPIEKPEKKLRKSLSSVRHAVVFGSPIPEVYMKKLIELLPNIYFMNYYGQSELTSAGTTLQYPDLLRKTEESTVRFNGAEPIGQPQVVNDIRIFDDDGKEVPRGTIGEIVVRGPSVMSGYYNDEEKTIETFRGGWHHSGDLGIMDEEGFLYFIDRKKDIVKTGGENVSTIEVEAVIYSHPGVAEVTVVGLQHPRWSEAVTAFIVLKTDVAVTEDEIINICKDQLAAYKIPKKCIFVNELPKNPSGKLLKRELRKRYNNIYAM